MDVFSAIQGRRSIRKYASKDIEDEKLSDGFIAFQYGGANGMVRFRNIRIDELP